MAVDLSAVANNHSGVIPAVCRLAGGSQTHHGILVPAPHGGVGFSLVPGEYVHLTLNSHQPDVIVNQNFGGLPVRFAAHVGAYFRDGAVDDGKASRRRADPLGGSIGLRLQAEIGTDGRFHPPDDHAETVAGFAGGVQIAHGDQAGGECAVAAADRFGGYSVRVDGMHVHGFSRDGVSAGFTQDRSGARDVLFRGGLVGFHAGHRHADPCLIRFPDAGRPDIGCRLCFLHDTFYIQLLSAVDAAVPEFQGRRLIGGQVCFAFAHADGDGAEIHLGASHFRIGCRLAAGSNVQGAAFHSQRRAVQHELSSCVGPAPGDGRVIADFPQVHVHTALCGGCFGIHGRFVTGLHVELAQGEIVLPQRDLCAVKILAFGKPAHHNGADCAKGLVAHVGRYLIGAAADCADTKRICGVRGRGQVHIHQGVGSAVCLGDVGLHIQQRAAAGGLAGFGFAGDGGFGVQVSQQRALQLHVGLRSRLVGSHRYAGCDAGQADVHADGIRGCVADGGGFQVHTACHVQPLAAGNLSQAHGAVAGDGSVDPGGYASDGCSDRAGGSFRLVVAIRAGRDIQLADGTGDTDAIGIDNSPVFGIHIHVADADAAGHAADIDGNQPRVALRFQIGVNRHGADFLGADVGQLRGSVGFVEYQQQAALEGLCAAGERQHVGAGRGSRVVQYADAAQIAQGSCAFAFRAKGGIQGGLHLGYRGAQAHGAHAAGHAEQIGIRRSGGGTRHVQAAAVRFHAESPVHRGVLGEAVACDGYACGGSHAAAACDGSRNGIRACNGMGSDGDLCFFTGYAGAAVYFGFHGALCQRQRYGGARGERAGASCPDGGCQHVVIIGMGVYVHCGRIGNIVPQVGPGDVIRPYCGNGRRDARADRTSGGDAYHADGAVHGIQFVPQAPVELILAGLVIVSRDFVRAIVVRAQTLPEFTGPGLLTGVGLADAARAGDGLDIDVLIPCVQMAQRGRDDVAAQLGGSAADSHAERGADADGRAV